MTRARARSGAARSPAGTSAAAGRCRRTLRRATRPQAPPGKRRSGPRGGGGSRRRLGYRAAAGARAPPSAGACVCVCGRRGGRYVLPGAPHNGPRGRRAAIAREPPSPPSSGAERPPNSAPHPPPASFRPAAPTTADTAAPTHRPLPGAIYRASPGPRLPPPQLPSSPRCHLSASEELPGLRPRNLGPSGAPRRRPLFSWGRPRPRLHHLKWRRGWERGSAERRRATPSPTPSSRSGAAHGCRRRAPAPTPSRRAGRPVRPRARNLHSYRRSACERRGRAQLRLAHPALPLHSPEDPRTLLDALRQELLPGWTLLLTPNWPPGSKPTQRRGAGWRPGCAAIAIDTPRSSAPAGGTAHAPLRRGVRAAPAQRGGWRVPACCFHP